MATTTEMHLPSSNEQSGRTIRFNYVGMHRYLITIPAFKPASLFKERETVLAVLDALGDASRSHHFDVYAYSFLPDSLTLIVRGKDDTSDMKQFLVMFRHASSERVEARLGHPLWKKKYMERVLRRQEDTKDVARDVFQGPVRAGLAVSAGEYEFQGSFVTNVVRTAVERKSPDWKSQKPSFGPPQKKGWKAGPSRGQGRPSFRARGESRNGGNRGNRG
jgi:REP element-mobilizing transposase RayT